MRELTTEPVVEASYKSAIVARRGSTCAAWLEDARVSACRERCKVASLGGLHSANELQQVHEDGEA